MFEMPQHCFGRSDMQPRAGRREDIAQGARLHRVAKVGAGAMGFDIGDLIRCHPRVFMRIADHRDLCGLVGRGKPRGKPVMVQRAAFDEHAGPAALGFCKIGAAQHGNAYTLATSETCGTIFERAAAAFGCQKAKLGKYGVFIR